MNGNVKTSSYIGQIDALISSHQDSAGDQQIKKHLSLKAIAKAITLQDQDNSLQNTLISIQRLIFGAHLLFAALVAAGRLYGRFLFWILAGY